MRRIKLLAAFSEQAPDKSVDFFAQQFVLGGEAGIFRQSATKLRRERRDRLLHLFQTGG